VLHVVEPGVDERQERPDAGVAPAAADDALDEDLAGGVDGGQLEVGLGPEVGEQPALADAELGREPADREPLEALG